MAFALDHRVQDASMGWLLWASMSESLLDRLVEEAVAHRRQLSCRQRYEGAVDRLPDARRNIRYGEDRNAA